MTASQKVLTTDSLIEVFGDQAYYKAIQMLCECVQAGDTEAAEALSHANAELMKRGYHKKGRNA